MDEERERACAPARVPRAMANAVAGYRWARSTVGESGGKVYRLGGKPGAPALYLKGGSGSVAGDVAAEADRLRWLAGHVPVPAVQQCIATRHKAWLLMTALPGRTAWQALAADRQGQRAVVDSLSAFLRRLHAIPVAGCPFDSGHVLRLAAARHRVETGAVDEDDFDDERAGWTAEQVWAALHRLLPFAPEPVVTHGDFSLDNLLLHDGAVAGCIDVGRAGVADRYQDIAILWNCLGEFDAALRTRFLAQYGIDRLDQRRLDFHLMLDELF